MKAETGFSALQLDALQETMNIGFGQAAASLTEVMELHVRLSVPRIVLPGHGSVAGQVRADLADPGEWSLAEQRFRGVLAGTGLLLVPEAESRALAGLFGQKACAEESAGGVEPGEPLRREVVLELANILIGACVGTIAALHGARVSWLPPRFIGGPVDRALLEERLRGEGGLAFKADFGLPRPGLTGFLFIAVSEESADWLRDAVDRWLGRIL